jgi:hypothetical protein
MRTRVSVYAHALRVRQFYTRHGNLLLVKFQWLLGMALGILKKHPELVL